MAARRRVAVILRASRPAEARRNKWLPIRPKSSVRYLGVSFGRQASEARITIVGTQPSRFSEFSGGAFGLADQGVGGGEDGATDRMCRHGVARLFEPDDRLVCARLQQMHSPNRLVPNAELRIAGAEPDSPLYERDRLFYRTSE